ncbi:acylphosphatase [Chitinimonas sp. JJ19]|uniref:acylphosphatase n=1 Tax=Chitinimonas sp. JJ19 TaxID=3109352 RepID=UPI001A415661|nr:acylphosphatase [Chitinimonas sp.]
MIARLVRIHGRVQGVGYRYAMEDQAQLLGLAGWVRNRLDGTVEAHAQGPADAVQALVDWAHQGPPHAQVSKVEVTDTSPTHETRFLRLPTA